MAADMASISTAPAARSLVRLIASLYPGETRSAMASIDEFTASAASTVPMAKVTAIHSVVDMSKRKTMYPCIVFTGNEQYYAVKGKLEALQPFFECKPVVLHLYIINRWLLPPDSGPNQIFLYVFLLPEVYQQGVQKPRNSQYATLRSFRVP